MRFSLFALVLAVLFLFAGVATAAPPEFGRPVFVVAPAPKFYPTQFAKFAPGAPGCFACTTCGPSCPCPAGACAAGGCPVPAAGVQYVQVCENGKCKLVPVNAAPVRAGDVFEDWRNGPPHLSGYTAGAPSVYTQTPNFMTPSGSCAGGQCQPAARTGWYPGKRLGR